MRATSPAIEWVRVVADRLGPLRSEVVTKAEGISWFAVGVGPDAEAGLQSPATVVSSSGEQEAY